MLILNSSFLVYVLWSWLFASGFRLPAIHDSRIHMQIKNAALRAGKSKLVDCV
jgi:hypothetical protein